MIAWVLVAGLAAALSGASPATATIPDESGDLLDEIESIRAAMPGRDSEGLTIPTSLDLQAWREVAGTLLHHRFDAVDSLVAAHFPHYELVRYTDTSFGNRVYYLLREKEPVATGWGTYIVNPDCERNILTEVPHPRYDINTHTEGADFFRRTGARFFLMAGTHRCANDAASPCSGTSSACGDGSYHVSDMAHYVAAPFQAVHEVLDAGSPGIYVFNLHGNGRSSCEDVFLSNGHATGSDSVLFALRNRILAAGGLTVGVAGDGVSDCTLIGSTNVQGRWTNGSPEPCTAAAAENCGRFIHVEQHRLVRDDPEEYGKLIEAVRQTIGTVTAAPDPVRAVTVGLGLSPPWPNPGHKATIQLSVANEQPVRIHIIDVGGRSVAKLHDGILEEGSYRFSFRDDALPRGLYLVSACGRTGCVARRWVLIR